MVVRPMRVAASDVKSGIGYAFTVVQVNGAAADVDARPRSLVAAVNRFHPGGRP
jgi:hypothetical protein